MNGLNSNQAAPGHGQQASLPSQFRAQIQMYYGSGGAGGCSGSPSPPSDGPPSLGPMDNRDNSGMQNNNVGGGGYNKILSFVSGGTNHQNLGGSVSQEQQQGASVDQRDSSSVEE